MGINIRPEKTSDIQNIDDVTVAAFLNAPHTDHTEQFIVKALRDSGALTISLIAEDSVQIIGHVALSPVAISCGSDGWYGLGPISVTPKEQGKGVGSKLMHAAIVELKKLNANGCVLLGDPNYYHRFGFKPLDSLIPPDVPAEYFQALVLQDADPKGTVTYHESFSEQD
ncbi:GNAT family N-acetyltransferase [Pelagibaculum spongiae]|uniref:GNAT family N-acetyltransferase n=1 Tax=Pelagibaculum spongiae TaxID=2080658 RepID=A0A2V1H003_9GAMM|nr:GNAT family N-acetyltransferase [Pelagibaculum spongiae]